jgi:two-component system response regulator HydG
VRELENAVERAVTLNVGGRLTPADFVQYGAASMTGGVAPQPSSIAPAEPSSEASWVCRLPSTLEEVEREHMLATLRFTKGNKLRAAELMGIGRYSLYRKARRLGIDLDNGSETRKQKSEAPGS